MDGLFHGKSYEKMDDLGGYLPLFLEIPKYKHPRRLTASLSQWLSGLNFLGSHV